MIKVGMPLNLESEEDQITYRCKVVDCTEHKLIIDYPFNEKTKKTAFLMKGTKLNAMFVGEDKAVYGFSTEVKDRAIKDIPVIELDYPGDDSLEAVQRRNFFRVPVTLTVVMEKYGEAKNSLQSFTRDLSAGGVCINLSERSDFKVNEEVKVGLLLKHEEEEVTLELQGKLVRVEQPINEQQGQLSVEFLSPNIKAKQLLMRYTLKRQLELRRKGLL
ncbi:flagellar brake domain-containing protein [Priestia flexa]|jgi:c-di-GMP-binding flagellar brake protein YcgR|uniref:Uncharacterized protein n=2 Tax=Priestia TaxID=2800373 RepID=A0A0V8JR63_9BACI|nr:MULTISPECIES: flagellar brake domain-containing protein [Bacillaceae]KSU89522.1 hypothetical protein AS180_01560 [Priestia veravalensis]KZB92578.1 hypothetical protein A2U94_05025 [Bacillus sp. VT 712]MBN8250245.1 flagellar brake domain-containing protein [Priestia flexa]MBN8432933.1 flagellar brake domain-containing protein [Priestia flexa]MCA0965081.1 flagellar brake domain-containing protein [Priestia flexa]